MAHKTKQAALKAARSDLGEKAIEGVDFTLRNTGTGWVAIRIPPATVAAEKAQAERLAPPEKPKGPAKRKLSGKPTPPKNVDDAKLKPGKLAKALSGPVATKAPRKSAKAPTPKPAAPEGQSKTEMIVEMLTTPGGATSKELEAATGWQPHSVRGLLGTLRKRGVNVVSKKLKGEPTIYRIAKGRPAAAAAEVGDVI